jgi:glycerol-3-phosphate cytidylyltransferase
MTTIITYGTFDIYHVGHVRLLRRLHGMGDRLIVGCSTDGFNKRKGKSSVMPYEDRVELLKSCIYVDEVFAEQDWKQKPNDILRYGVDIFAMGDDWAGKFDYLKEYCEVVYLSRTPGVSSTELKKQISAY